MEKIQEDTCLENTNILVVLRSLYILRMVQIAKDLFVQWTQTQTTHESNPEDDRKKETENVKYGNLIESLANIHCGILTELSRVCTTP